MLLVEINGTELPLFSSTKWGDLLKFEADKVIIRMLVFLFPHISLDQNCLLINTWPFKWKHYVAWASAIFISRVEHDLWQSESQTNDTVLIIFNFCYSFLIHKPHDSALGVFVFVWDFRKMPPNVISMELSITKENSRNTWTHTNTYIANNNNKLPCKMIHFCPEYTISSFE